MDKDIIRKEIKELFLSNKHRFLDHKINEILIGFLKDFNKIALYEALSDEVSLSELKNAYLNKKELYLPKINNDSLVFNLIKDDSSYEKNIYSINELKSNTNYSINDLNVVIVPLRAYDLKLNRVGRGKGFYDKTLNNSVIKVGVAYSFQEVNKINVLSNDIKLDYLVNEKGVICI